MKLFSREVTSIYDEPITKVLEELRVQSVETEEWSTAMRHLETLTKLKADEKPKRVSRDTMAMVAGNLLGILVIVAYEQKHVMGSQGLKQLLKPKS